MRDKFSQILSCHEIKESLDELRDIIFEWNSTELDEVYLATAELLFWIINTELRGVHVLWSLEGLAPIL